MPKNVLIPMKLDCFVFNEAVCNGTSHDAKIAPITQPNYTLLRYERQLVTSDILRHADLHSASPATANSRFINLGTQTPHKHRQGVYVHWMIPRPFRTAYGSTEKKEDKNSKANKTTDQSATSFYDVPSRWLVIRKLDPASIQPKDAKIPELQAWIVESDRKWTIDELGPDVDLQTDVSPYVAVDTNSNAGSNWSLPDIAEQTEVFIGQCFKAEDWDDKKTAQNPRVSLNLFNSSNQLFADYQPHNSNVFSLIDRFEYEDEKGDEQTLAHAKASYYVLGWQPDTNKDLFNLKTRGSENITDHFNTLKLAMNGWETDEIVKVWKAGTDASRSLCHGSMYDVVWDVKDKPDSNSADDTCKRLMDDSPVAIGTTPLDSILAYVKGHRSKSAPGSQVHELERVLYGLQALLLSRDEGVDAQRRAINVLSNLNFQRFDGGKQYHLASTRQDDGTNPGSNVNQDPANASTYEPSVQDKLDIADLNQKQRRADSLANIIRKKQWDLFAGWWKYLTDIEAETGRHVYHTAIFEQVTADLLQLTGELNTSNKQIEDAKAKLSNSNIQPQIGTAPPFHQYGDPTVLIAGITTGWPVDYINPLKVRLRHQIVSGVKDNDPKTVNLGQYLEEVLSKLGDFVDDAKILFSEFLNLAPEKKTAEPTGSLTFPLYHDQKLQILEETDKTKDLWRDKWQGQAWFPLFLEWEVEYYHVGFELWSMDDGKTSPNKLEDNKVRYRIKANQLTKKDARILSGRALILPQPNFSLKAKIQQLLNETAPTILKEHLSDDDKTLLDSQIDNFTFLSAPLSGFTNHLLTRSGGTHVKPTYRQPEQDGKPAQTPKAIDRAWESAHLAGYRKKHLEDMGMETDLTPYGTAQNFPSTDPNPFKPVTHGQFRITKLNIIDKFGQVAHAIDPDINADPQPLKPYVSEYYAPQQLLGRPEVIDISTGGKNDPYEFMQIPPQINQPARLNASWVKLAKNSAGNYWQPVSQWEPNVVWGWIVVNYANFGIQFFLPDGSFYREVRLGGPTNVLVSPLWLPKAPSNIEDGKADQLQALIDQLSKDSNDNKYLKSFIDMLNLSLDTMQPAPGAYSEFLSASIGHPLALVNMAWSVELATEPYESHAMLSNPTIERQLIPPPLSKKSDAASNLSSASTAGEDTPASPLYSFQLKLGDQFKSYDGLVGYWKQAADDPKSLKPGNSLDLSTLYTYYTTVDGSPSFQNIDQTTFPELQAYWLPPDEMNAADLDATHCRKLVGFGAIIDPFTPVHGYNCILPVRELSLPPYTWQKAFEKMDAFFHLGPLLVTQNVPETKDTTTRPAKPGPHDPPPATVKIPSLTVAKWDWLQPYVRDGADEKTELENAIEYDTFAVAPVDVRARIEEGPFTALEGYLQVRKG
jgi:hypothetical protein